MRGLLTASYWLGLPACTAGVHLTQQLSDQNDKHVPKSEPGYDIMRAEEMKPPMAGATLKQVQVRAMHPVHCHCSPCKRLIHLPMVLEHITNCIWSNYLGFHTPKCCSLALSPAPPGPKTSA